MNRSVERICVYCGSGSGENPAHAKAARTLGKALADADIGLVYGGGNIGLMGEIAHAVLENGGHVTGIIPEFLVKWEVALENVSEMIVTDSMHERKQLMFEKSDAFVALPGGVGTLEELVEQLTWSQLGQHSKPMVLLNIDDFWRPLLTLFDAMRAENFIRTGLHINLGVVDTAENVLPKILETAALRDAREEESAIPSKF
jgi:uncharacterized protein (TIGR00730 family)